MTYTKNISRKKDFKVIEKIINYNEYYPRNVSITFDKNFFFYLVKITPVKGVDKSEMTSIHSSQMKELYKNGFIIQDLYLRITNQGHDAFHIDLDQRFKDLNFELEIKLVRMEEIPKYFSRGSFY